MVKWYLSEDEGLEKLPGLAPASWSRLGSWTFGPPCPISYSLCSHVIRFGLSWLGLGSGFGTDPQLCDSKLQKEQFRTL